MGWFSSSQPACVRQTAFLYSSQSIQRKVYAHKTANSCRQQSCKLRDDQERTTATCHRAPIFVSETCFLVTSHIQCQFLSSLLLLLGCRFCPDCNRPVNDRKLCKVMLRLLKNGKFWGPKFFCGLKTNANFRTLQNSRKVLSSVERPCIGSNGRKSNKTDTFTFSFALILFYLLLAVTICFANSDSTKGF